MRPAGQVIALARMLGPHRLVTYCLQGFCTAHWVTDKAQCGNALLKSSIKTVLRQTQTPRQTLHDGGAEPVHVLVVLRRRKAPARKVLLRGQWAGLA